MAPVSTVHGVGLLKSQPDEEFVLAGSLKTAPISGDVHADAMRRLTRKGGRIQLPADGSGRTTHARRSFGGGWRASEASSNSFTQWGRSMRTQIFELVPRRETRPVYISVAAAED